ncbi:MAG: hypothetical protein ACM3TN_01065 [Alphaproteobacteria bacterium]
MLLTAGVAFRSSQQVPKCSLTTQREAMIEAGPPPATQETKAPPAQQEKGASVQKAKEPAKK